MANIPISKINKEASSINNNDLLIISQPDSSVENGYVSAKVKWSTVKNNIDVNNIEYLSQSEYDSKKAAGLLDPTKYYATPVDKTVNPIIDYTTEQTATLSWDSTDKKTYIKNSNPKVYYTAERNEIVYTSGSLDIQSQPELVEAYVIPKDNSLPIKFFTLKGSAGDVATLDTTIILNEGDQLYFSTADNFTSQATTDVNILSYELNGIGGIGSGSGYGAGGGVIDGTILKGPTNIPLTTGSASNLFNESYTAENDCYLVISTSNLNLAPNAQIVKVKVNDEFVGYMLDNSEFGNNLRLSFSIPVKAGSVVNLSCTDTNGYVTDATENTKLTFTEYKLSSLNPQIAMPDWDADKKILIPNSNWTVPKNGYIIHDVTQGQAVNWTKINTIKVSGELNHGGVNPDYCIPVSKGDVFEYELASIYSGTPFVFYPCKSVVQDASSVIELLYPVGSIYFDGNNSNTCPLEAVISGSTWETVGTKLLTDGSTAPVVGNGTALVFDTATNATGHSSNYTVLGINEGGSELVKGAGLSAGSGNALTIKSGLVTDLSSATGLSVKIWKRIS